MRSFLLVLLVFGLSAQNAGAGFITHCIHQNNTLHEFSTEVQQSDDDYRNYVNHQLPMKGGNAAGEQRCGTGAICHTSCNMMPTASFFPNNFSNNSSIPDLQDRLTADFISSPPHHPPRI
ncbi:MAG: hypothetical protein H6940_01510 [Burkholderiales bacterium]|nr:hypothetical protein [Burkholderiales bacterium]